MYPADFPTQLNLQITAQAFPTYWTCSITIPIMFLQRFQIFRRRLVDLYRLKHLNRGFCSPPKIVGTWKCVSLSGRLDDRFPEKKVRKSPGYSGKSSSNWYIIIFPKMHTHTHTHTPGTMMILAILRLLKVIYRYTMWAPTSYRLEL